MEESLGIKNEGQNRIIGTMWVGGYLWEGEGE
jgi:hypothetical protein